MPRTKTKPTDHTLDVLHVIRVVGLIDTDEITARTGLSDDTVTGALTTLAASEHVNRREGRRPGWRVTDPGKERHRQLLHAEMTNRARRRAIEDLHHAFTPINVSFKTVCTEWQLRNGSPNDHSDRAYDASVIARLHDLHDQLDPALSAAAVTVAGLTSYQPRFAAALGRLDGGDLDAFVRPLSGSYHDVWMELHQDLILRLELQRGDDDA
jgi:hypothetical protein